MCSVSPVQPPPSGPPPQAPHQAPGLVQPQPGYDASEDSLSPELFTGIVQGVLSTMMSSLGARQGNGESIAQFIQRLSQTSNLFNPGSGDAVGQSLGLFIDPFTVLNHELLILH